MSVFSPISPLCALGILLAASAARAEYGGRLGRIAEEAVAATRIEAPASRSLPITLCPPQVPACVVVTDMAKAVERGASFTIRAPPVDVGIPAVPSYVLTRESIPTVPAGTVATAVFVSPAVPSATVRGYSPARSMVQTPPSAKSVPRILGPPSGRPLPPLFAESVYARLVLEGLADGSLNPRDAAWRPHLALLLSGSEPTPDADAIFSMLLGGCAGHDARAKIAAAEAWAAGHQDGRFASAIAYAAARHEFAAGNYSGTASRCKRIIDERPEIADRAMLLLALAQAQTRDREPALRTLQELCRLYPASPAAPEARFMEAWLALQDARNEEAAAILRAIVSETPRAPAAAKAAQMLASLEAIK